MNEPLRILPLGGLGEIGMNCLVLEYADEILIVDCGLMFSDLDHFGVEFAIPDFSWLRERKQKVSGFLITHGHEDHIGALPFALKAGIRAPIYASAFSAMLLKERLKDHGLESEADIRVFRDGDRLPFRHFSVEPVPVNHSIVDAFAMFIDTPHGKVIHTGDFKIDPTPFYGSQLEESRFRKAGDEGVLLLMSDSTNVERHQHTLSENRIYETFENLFAAAEGLTVIAMFASNVARIGQVLSLAERMGKKVAVTGRSMDQNLRLAQELGYCVDAPNVVIPVEEIGNHRRSDVVILSGGSQAELGSALQRMAHGEHRQVILQPKDRVLMSSRHIPGNEKIIGRMINRLFKQGAEVLYEAVHEIHSSGHASRPELKRMLEWTKPKFFLPIHGEYRHLVHHGKLGEEVGIPSDRICVVENGAVLELSDAGFACVEQLEEPRVLVEGRQGGDVSKLVLKDRRVLGERGVVFALLVRNEESRRIIAGPELVSKGFANETLALHLMDEARKLVKKLINEYDRNLREGQPEPDFQETVRVELRRFFERNLGHKPTVMPMILDI